MFLNPITLINNILEKKKPKSFFKDNQILKCMSFTEKIKFQLYNGQLKYTNFKSYFTKTICFTLRLTGTNMTSQPFHISTCEYFHWDMSVMSSEGFCAWWWGVGRQINCPSNLTHLNIPTCNITITHTYSWRDVCYLTYFILSNSNLNKDIDIHFQ